MPYFNVMLSGKGIKMPFEGSPDPVIGFFTTRRVRADDVESAQIVARASVLSEWQSGGEYAVSNEGDLPALEIEECWKISWFETLTKRKPAGYAFFVNED